MTEKPTLIEQTIAAHINDCATCKRSASLKVGSEIGLQLVGLCDTGLSLAQPVLGLLVPNAPEKKP